MWGYDTSHTTDVLSDAESVWGRSGAVVVVRQALGWVCACRAVVVRAWRGVVLDTGGLARVERVGGEEVVVSVAVAQKGWAMGILSCIVLCLPPL